ncbi:hypothetical protein [Acidithiobacillus sp.]|uniref:hypothetical protein n=1 Tax=Acidithiobacillus sp. TaxID=1872118 RepID=UPI003D035312
MSNLVLESSASPKAKPDTSEKPYLLTPSEIDSLRREMHMSGVMAKAELFRRYPNREMPDPKRQ